VIVTVFSALVEGAVQLCLFSALTGIEHHETVSDEFKWILILAMLIVVVVLSDHR